MISIIFTIILLGFIVFVFILDGDKSKIPTKKNKKNNKNNKGADNSSKANNVHGKNTYKTQDKINIQKIKSIGDGEDPSLIVKDNNEYAGILEVYGVNYNLLSSRERLTLEEVFQSMINGIDYPVQLFIQSRRIDIENYRNIYNNRLDELADRLKQERNKLSLQLGKGRQEEILTLKIIYLDLKIK